MQTLRLSEIYPSMQGEGGRVGEATLFVRFAGCNMRCPGWPCDTPHAIDPKIWRNESERLTPSELFDRIDGHDIGNICWTGGEPFMQDNDRLEDLWHLLDDNSFRVECFSNGSYSYPDWALENIHFMMDWKLEGSGEADTRRDMRWRNAIKLKPTDGIKFVVKDVLDLHEAVKVTEEMELADVRADLWVGAAWGHISDKEIVEFTLRNALPWKLNMQVHKYIWPPEERGV